MVNIPNIRGSSSQALLLGLLVVGTACQGERPDPLPHANPQPAKIAWTMTRVDHDSVLRIEYRVTNVSDGRIYLNDIIHQVRDGKHSVPDPQRIAVMNDSEPHVVRFLRGPVPTLVSPNVPYLNPGFRPIDPGQTVSGYAQVQLPLQAESYAGFVRELNFWPNAAVLQLGYFQNEPSAFEVPLAEGGILRISSWSQPHPLQWLRSEIKPIPSRPFWKVF